MTAREIEKSITQSPSSLILWSKDYRNNSNTQSSNITFPGTPHVGNDVSFHGLIGPGTWSLSNINVTGDVQISDSNNVIILGGTVDKWTEKSGNIIFLGTTVGDGTTHYDIHEGFCRIQGTFDHSTPSDHSIICGNLGNAYVSVFPGSLNGSANLFDLLALEGGHIYYMGDAAADGVTFDPASPGVIQDTTGYLVNGQKIIRHSFMHIASESGGTVYPSSSNIQFYDLQAFEADTTNRPVVFTQNTLGFNPLKANGGFDISWMPVGFEFEMWMILARFGSTSINQYIKFDVSFFNSSDVIQRHRHGNSNWIDNGNNERNIFRDYRQTLDEDYLTVASFSSDENDHFPGGQDNEFTIIAFSFLMLTGFQ